MKYYDMKYKIGDKVRIKTWEKMKIGRGLVDLDTVAASICWYTPSMEQELLALNSNRILTIKEVNNFQNYYITEELACWGWSDDMIEGLYEDIEKTMSDDSIVIRFDLMEL